MLLYITGGVGFLLSVLAILLILVFHKKDKSKVFPLIVYFLGFVLFMGSGFLHWKGFELNLPAKEPSDEVQQDDAVDDSNSDDDPVQNDDTDDEGQDDPDLSTPDEEEDIPDDESDSNEDQSVSLETISSLIKIAVADNFPNCTTSVDEESETICVNVWIDGLAQEVLNAQLSGREDYSDSWENATGNMATLSNTIKDLAETAGRPDAHILLNVLNDQNTENTLLSILDGSIIYDSLAE